MSPHLLHLRNHKEGLSCTCTIEACTYQRMQTSEATTSRHVCSTHGRLITHKKIGDFEGGARAPFAPLNPPLYTDRGRKQGNPVLFHDFQLLQPTSCILSSKLMLQYRSGSMSIFVVLILVDIRILR